MPGNLAVFMFVCSGVLISLKADVCYLSLFLLEIRWLNGDCDV